MGLDGSVDAAWEAVASVVSEDDDEYAQLTRRAEAIGATTPEPSGDSLMMSSQQESNWLFLQSMLVLMCLCLDFFCEDYLA